MVSMGGSSAGRGTEAALRYGGFTVGEMRLALPLSDLVKVVPAEELVCLPCELPAVLGGLVFRGGVVPVIELHRALGLAGGPARRACVLLVRNAGRVLGLAVDRTLGVFEPAPGQPPWKMGQVPGDAAEWLLGSLEVAGEERPLLVLSLASVFAEPDLPFAEEPPVDGAPALSEPAIPLLVAQTQGVQIAIDALAVHGTMPAPELIGSPLARGHCRGVLAVEEGLMPVVDLLSLVGLGRTSTGPHSKVLRLLVGERLLGLLVDDVLEIASLAPSELACLPACALAHADLFAGVLSRQGALGEAQTCYVLDAAALAAHAELQALAGVSGVKRLGSAAAGRSLGVSDQPAAEMLVYEAGMPAATLLEQVEEVLPSLGAGGGLEGQAPLLGLVPHRGHGIPVFCLPSLLGLQPAGPAAHDCVLVVPRSDGQRIGFAVPRLSFIERASWHTTLRGRAQQLVGLARAAQSGEVALFGGSGGQPERMVPVVDLLALAGMLDQREAATQEGAVA